jgi:hypothetical protein
VTRLRLKSGRLAPDGLLELSSGAWFANVRELELAGHSRGPRGLSSDTVASIELLKAPNLAALKIGCAEPTRGAIRVLTNGAFPRLGKLAFQYTDLGPDGVEELTAARGWPLRHLELDEAHAGTAGADALAAWPLLDGLRVLDVSGCNLSARAVRVLVSSPLLAGLRHLDLSSNPLGRAGLVALAQSKHLRGLRVLRLFHTQDGAAKHRASATDGAAFLAALDMPELRHLHNWDIPVGTRGAQVLARSERFANLTQLTLERAALGDAGARALLEAPHLQRLVYLNLCTNDLNGGLEPLTRKAVMPHLGHCVLYFNRPDNELARALYRRPEVEM